jgi:threonine synthase
MKEKFTVRCMDCNTEAPYLFNQPACPNCGSLWRDAIYDTSTIALTYIAEWSKRPFDLWRYFELLPLQTRFPELYLGEGGTPLLKATNLGSMIGCKNIYIKDERQGPTASFKDRQAAVTIAALKEAGVNEMVVASTGNVAIAYSAYAARAGIKLWAFLTSLVPAEKMREVAIYGTQVIKVTGSYDQTKKIASEFASQRNIFYDLGARNIPCIEAMKTIAFEIAEQLSASMGPGNSFPLRAPDWYIQSVSGGMGPLGVIKGFMELKAMNLIDKVPKIAVVQVAGCAPMVNAWQLNQENATPVSNPKTLIETLATGDPGRSYTLLRKRMLENNSGTFVASSDEDTFRAMHLLAKMEGLSVEPAAAVAFSGLIQILRNGQIMPDDIVVVNNTGHTFPIESAVLGEGWSYDIDLAHPALQESQEEGLLAALSKVASDRYPRVLIIDDLPEARRLLRRILQSQGNFTLFEAENGKEGIHIAIQEKPNLILLDLMMPEMDGFAVMEALQNNKATGDIPIVVVTAKELTAVEKQRLHGRIQNLLQKGDFISEELQAEVKSLLS